MRSFVVVTVPQDLLPQVVGELLQFTTDPNKVDVVHDVAGRVIHVDPLVAEAWLEFRRAKEQRDLAELQPEPQPEPEPKAPEPAPVPEAAPVADPTPAPAPAPTPAPAPAPPVAKRPPAKAVSRDS